MSNKISILGYHPLQAALLKQCLEIKYEVYEHPTQTESIIHVCDELFLLPTGADDNATMATLKQLAQKEGWTGRPVVHLLLQSPASLWMLQTMDLPAEVNKVFEVYPFTMEDAWAKKILVHLPGISDSGYPRLDREPIGADSKQTVHLVISGFDKQAEAVALNAALVAHFPNYDCNDSVPLRTRITIIDSDIKARRDDFLAMYQHLFDNSFYRTVDIKDRKCEMHRPIYYGQRKDFVDVEWEFVDGSINDETVRQKLVAWVQDERQQLTVVVSHENDEKNLSQCVSLPAEIYERHIPVFVRQRQGGLADSVKQSLIYNNVYPFGMEDCGYDVTLPLVRMAKMLNYFYDYSYSHKKDDTQEPPTVLPSEDVEEAWRKVKSYKFRLSNICNVMTISSKMHSLGHDTDDVDKFYALTADEIHSLAATEHNRWSVERLMMGCRPCTDEEKTEIRNNIAAILATKKGEQKPTDLKKKYKNEKDVHFDLCAYDELEVDPTGKNAQVYDYDLTACIPLIAKTFYDETNGKD